MVYAMRRKYYESMLAEMEILIRLLGDFLCRELIKNFIRNPLNINKTNENKALISAIQKFEQK